MELITQVFLRASLRVQMMMLRISNAFRKEVFHYDSHISDVQLKLSRKWVNCAETVYPIDDREIYVCLRNPGFNIYICIVCRNTIFCQKHKGIIHYFGFNSDHHYDNMIKINGLLLYSYFHNIINSAYPTNPSSVSCSCSMVIFCRKLNPK
jgi:hypothetical protein